MRKLINSTYLTLDGVIENPAWTAPYFAEEAAELAGELTTGADALLMGRVTYEGFAQAWPAMDESDPTTGAAFFNNVKKYVASTTLENPTWKNSEVLAGDLVEAVAKLKADPGKNIVQYGYGEVTAQLVKAGLVDEVTFWIHPVIVGGPSFSSVLGDVTATFDLIGTRVFGNGVVVATYRPKATA